nr:DEAD/DEAH box helicase [Actinomycetota bacterium]
MQSFHELGVSSSVAQALAERDIHTPFRIQALVLPDVLDGRDVLAKSPTGSGKTLAFAIPIVEHLDASDPRPSALILVPTRELAAQVAAELETIAPARNLKVAAVYGGISIPAQAKKAREAHILVATPGRLQDLMERRMVKLDGVRILILDEADRMLDMGFQPQVDRIVARLPRERQTMFFSATLDGAVGELAHAYTRNAARHEGTLPPEHEQGEVEHRFISVTMDNKVEKLAELLAEDRGLALVFVRTKRGAERLVQKLARQNVHAVAMHGDMSQNARERALSRFEKGAVSTLIATDVAARGLDLDDITHVINFDPPEDNKGYV